MISANLACVSAAVIVRVSHERREEIVDLVQRVTINHLESFGNTAVEPSRMAKPFFMQSFAADKINVSTHWQ